MGKGGVFSAEYEPAVCCSKLKIITISFHTFHSLLEKIQLRYLSSTPTSQKLRSSSCQSVSQELVISAQQVPPISGRPNLWGKPDISEKNDISGIPDPFFLGIPDILGKLLAHYLQFNLIPSDLGNLLISHFWYFLRSRLHYLDFRKGHWMQR